MGLEHPAEVDFAKLTPEQCALGGAEKPGLPNEKPIEHAILTGTTE